MNGNRIHHVLTLDPYSSKKFQGFSSPDLPLPKIRRLPAIFILNTAPSWSGGEHWCVACFAKDGTCDFFDPYARSPDDYGFTHQLLFSCKKEIRFNTIPVQGILAKTCGHHCLFFALKYARNKKPEFIMNMYDKNNIRKNDNMVYEYLKRTCGSIIATIEE